MCIYVFLKLKDMYCHLKKICMSLNFIIMFICHIKKTVVFICVLKKTMCLYVI